MRCANQHVRREWNQAADDIGAGDHYRARAGALRIGTLQAELETHHEVDPLLRLPRHRFHDGCDVLVGDAVLAEDIRHFFHLLARNLADLLLLSPFLGSIVFGIALGSEIAAESHGNRAGGDFGQSGSDDDARLLDRPGEAGSQRERHC